MIPPPPVKANPRPNPPVPLRGVKAVRPQDPTETEGTADAVGIMVGWWVGPSDGAGLGRNDMDGNADVDGAPVGATEVVGACEGVQLGCTEVDGRNDGLAVGDPVGWTLGSSDCVGWAELVGATVGASDMVGMKLLVGLVLGKPEGDTLGA